MGRERVREEGVGREGREEERESEGEMKGWREGEWEGEGRGREGGGQTSLYSYIHTQMV